MALPPILATGSHLDLLVKSEKEVFEIIESAVALADWRWPKELHRLLKPFYTKLVDSDSDDGHITSAAASDRETEVGDPTKRRKIIRIQLRPVGKARTASAAPFSPPPKPVQETEDDLRKRRAITGAQTVRELDSSNFQKPTTTAVKKAVRATAAPKPALKRKFEEEEYEKKLENCKRKLREGYNQYTDSRKRSKVIAYIPPQSNHDRLSDQKKSKLLRR